MIDALNGSYTKVSGYITYDQEKDILKIGKHLIGPGMKVEIKTSTGWQECTVIYDKIGYKLLCVQTYPCSYLDKKKARIYIKNERDIIFDLNEPIPF